VLDRGANGKEVTPDVLDVGQTAPGHVLVMVLDGARRHLAGLLLVEPRKRLGGLTRNIVELADMRQSGPHPALALLLPFNPVCRHGNVAAAMIERA
jgi:hypothetical protein